MRLCVIAALLVASLLGCSAPLTQNECPARTTDGGTLHERTPAIIASETWSAAGNPHIVASDLRIESGGVLTLEPCVEVRMRGSRTIVVVGSGKLLAEGTEKRPISLKAEEGTAAWGSMQFFGPGSGRFAYATIAGGGGESGSAYGAIEVRGDQLLAAQPLLFVDHVTVTSSANYGVSLRAGATFTPDSRELVISGSKKAPVRVLPRLVTNLPSGTYTGNAEDVVQVETEAYGDVSLEDVTFHDRGIPYRIGGDTSFGELKVGAPSGLVTLTLEPGVTLKFNKNGAAGLVIDSGSTDAPATGALVAVGTSAKPIVLTSAAPFAIAGDWRGVTFGNRPAASNRLDFVRIEFAGGPSQAKSFHCRPDSTLSQDEDAALTLYGQPTFAFVTNSTFLSSAALGVNLAYRGMTYDFLSTNTFTSVVGCKQSTPRNQDGSCPTNVSCP